MKRSTILAIVGAAAAVIVVTVGVIFYVRGSGPNRGIPPLPANARVFNNWALICQTGNAPRCGLLNRVVNRQTQRIVLQMNITRAQNGSPILILAMPPNVAIAPGVTMTPMGGTAAKAAVRLCRPQTCTAVMALSEMFIKEVSATTTTAMEFVTANGQTVRLNLPTAGFDRGFAAWQAAFPAPPVVAAPASGAAAAGKAPPAPAVQPAPAPEQKQPPTPAQRPAGAK